MSHDDRAFSDAAYAEFRIDRATAGTFREWRIDPADARSWIEAGVDNGLDAVRWQLARATPSTCGEWRERGISAQEAVGWVRLGLSPDEAADRKAAGQRPDEQVTRAPSRQVSYQQVQTPFDDALVRRQLGELPTLNDQDVRDFFERVEQLGTCGGLWQHHAVGYIAVGWIDDEACSWLSAGFTLHGALDWRALGLRPGEAAALAAEGQTAATVAFAWWQAGIPYDEAASWLGGGLTPEEAVEQRAKGVTAEQAAVLRSLRREQ